MILVAFLTLAELLVIALCVIGLLGLRLRSVAREAKRLARLQAKEKQPFDPFSYFTQAVKNTENLLNNADDKHISELRVRLCYLQAELNAVAQNDYEGFWRQLYRGLAPLLPEPVLAKAAKAEPPPLAELDDPDPMTDPDSAIPTLEAQVTPAHTASNEVIRLRKLIGRQHQTIEELKQVMLGCSLSADDAHVLELSIQDVEVAHAQLNIGLDSIERENSRLHSALTAVPVSAPVNTAAAELAAEFEAQLPQDNTEVEEVREATEAFNEEAIEFSETDDDPLDAEAQIEALTMEIAELDEHLQQRSEDLRRLESLDMDLSHDEATEVAEDPEQVRAEIEIITEMLAARREDLAQLSPESIVDVHAKAANDDSAEAEEFPAVDWEDALTESADDQWPEAAADQDGLPAQQDTAMDTLSENDTEDSATGFPDINWDDAIAEIDTDSKADTHDGIDSEKNAAIDSTDVEEAVDIDALLAGADEDEDTALIPDIDDLNFTVDEAVEDSVAPNQGAKAT